MTAKPLDDATMPAKVEELTDGELEAVAAGAKEEVLEFPGAKGTGEITKVVDLKPVGDDAKLDPQKKSFGGNAAEGSSHI